MKNLGNEGPSVPLVPRDARRIWLDLVIKLTTKMTFTVHIIGGLFCHIFVALDDQNHY